jgi:hypothetical protein
VAAVASFILLPRAALSGLRDAAMTDTYWDFLARAGKQVADYQWSGYVLATLLCCLKDDYQVDLLTSPDEELSEFLSKARGSTHVVLSPEQRDAYLEKLDPSSLSVEKLRDYYNKFNEVDEPNSGAPMIDGVRAIQQSLTQLDSASVVVLVIS